VREIYEARKQEGATLIAVVGDFNDIPGSAPLAPLLEQGSDLRDVSTHPTFVDDGRPRTFGNGTKAEKIDYLLLAPRCSPRFRRRACSGRACGVGRTGRCGISTPR